MMRVREVAVVAVLAGVLAWGVVPRAQEKPAEAPVFTEVQQLRLQNFALSEQALSAQIMALQMAQRQTAQDREAYIVSLEREHPGWLLNRASLKWEPAPKK